MNRTPGPNDPCPCGSGKKYKKCCMGREETGQFNSFKDDVFAGLFQAIEGKTFASLEEAQAFADRFLQRRNQTPIKEFHGISPEQMHRFLDFPFSSPQLVSFPERLDTAPSAPILSLFSLLADAIGARGLKTTAKGNLPRNSCRDMALAYWGEERYRHNTRSYGINREEDVPELHVTRLVAEMAGLIRKYEGKFILTRACRSLLAESGPTRIYPRLFRAYVERFNWGYRDRYPDLPFIQHSFLFTLYLLGLYGDKWRAQVYYEDCFIQAFPLLLREVEPGPYTTAEQEIRTCYAIRTLVRFAGFLGLAEAEPLKNEPYPRDHRIMKLPLLDDAVRFHMQK
ncbi:MAG: SEC-C metal-binding domain-containing protein [bacterium]